MDKRIILLKNQMLSNLRETLTVKKMAIAVNLSESHLQQLFKREVEMSPVQYLKHLRLEQAREMLKNSFLQIKEIGFAVGMPDQSHFSRDFKDKFGATPSEYRKQHWAKTAAEELDADKS